MGRGHRSADDERDVLLSRGSAASRLPERSPADARAPGAGAPRLAVWSAGCSTGEEVYTIGVLVQQSSLFPRRAQPGTRRRRGTFASTAPTSRAGASPQRVGGSTARAASGRRPTTSRRAFFHERPDGWHVTEAIRQLCHFGQMNLLDEDRSRVLGRADAIFCRNVLIYFDARARKTAIEVLYDRLNPGGVLLLGHSESLLNVSTAFELLHLRDDLVYRKPLSARGATPVPDDRNVNVAPRQSAHPPARRRRLGVQPAQHRRRVRGPSGRRGRRQGRRRRRGAPARDAPRSPTSSRSTSRCRGWTGSPSCAS